MLKYKSLYFLLLISLNYAHAGVSRGAVSVENQTGEPIKVGIYALSCRSFEGDRYGYVPCAEKDIPANGTAKFENIIPNDPALTHIDRSLVPHIRFSSYAFGLSYACKMKRPPAKTPEDEIPMSATILVLQGATLFFNGNYLLLILPGYGYFPRPYVECDGYELKEESEYEFPPVESRM